MSKHMTLRYIDLPNVFFGIYIKIYLQETEKKQGDPIYQKNKTVKPL